MWLVCRWEGFFNEMLLVMLMKHTATGNQIYWKKKKDFEAVLYNFYSAVEKLGKEQFLVTNQTFL